MAVKLLTMFVKIPTQESIDAAFVILNTCGHKMNEEHKNELISLINLGHNTSVYNMRFAIKVKVST